MHQKLANTITALFDLRREMRAQDMPLEAKDITATLYRLGCVAKRIDARDELKEQGIRFCDCCGDMVEEFYLVGDYKEVECPDCRENENEDFNYAR